MAHFLMAYRLVCNASPLLDVLYNIVRCERSSYIVYGTIARRLYDSICKMLLQINGTVRSTNEIPEYMQCRYYNNTNNVWYM